MPKGNFTVTLMLTVYNNFPDDSVKCVAGLIHPGNQVQLLDHFIIKDWLLNCATRSQLHEPRSDLILYIQKYNEHIFLNLMDNSQENMFFHPKCENRKNMPPNISNYVYRIL